MDRSEMVRKAFLTVSVLLIVALMPSFSNAEETPYMCLGYEATIVGTDRDDDLVGTEGPDVIVGLKGNDRIDGLEGDDLICGNANWGNGSEESGRLDALSGGPGDDRISGGWGVDLIDGGEGDDFIRGGRGSDREDWPDWINGSLIGGPGNDVIRGGSGDDDLEGGGGGDEDGADFLYGGTGNDSLYDDSHRYCGGYGCLSSDRANDSLFGGPGRDGLYTTGGDDYQYGGYGDDSLGRSAGEALSIYGEPRAQDTGDDTYDGGPGRDSVTANHASTSPVFVDLSAGRASSDSLGEDVLIALEVVYGSHFDDTILGDDGPNWLIGGLLDEEGNDRLVGRGGDDVLDVRDGEGSDRFDSVDGGEGNDSCPADPDDELSSCEI